MDLTDVKIRIKEHEGFCLEPYNLEYKTSDGTVVKEDFQTGGYGHVIQKGEEIPTTREGWDKVFEEDFAKAVKNCSKLLNTGAVHPVAFGIVVEMIYQIGHAGVAKFKKTLSLINQGDYKGASEEMLDSKWARQTPSRAQSLSTLMSSIIE
jgi:lysozyme